MAQGTNKHALADTSKEDLERMYHDEMLSQYDIAQRLGVTQGAIAYHFRKLGIKSRPQSQAVALTGRFKGEKNPRWNGGRTTGNGYVLIKRPDHHRADCRGYVREHILVWEKANKTRLPKGWHVHHKNGVKDDNRPENLEAMSNSKHKDVIPSMLRRIARLETENRRLRNELQSLRSQQGRT